MNYNDARKYITALHIYYGVTQEELRNCPHQIYVTYVAGSMLVGMNEPYDMISGKELPYMDPEIIIPTKTVPSQVTRRQALLALHQAGVLESIRGAIAAIPAPDGPRIQIEFDNAQDFERNWPLMALLKLVIGLTDDQIDDLFILANTL